MSLVLAGFTIAAAPHAHADSSVTQFSFTSATGDYIGAGAHANFVPPTATFTIGGTAGNVHVMLTTATEN